MSVSGSGNCSFRTFPGPEIFKNGPMSSTSSKSSRDTISWMFESQFHEKSTQRSIENNISYFLKKLFYQKFNENKH